MISEVSLRNSHGFGHDWISPKISGSRKKIVEERVASTEKEASYNRKGDQSANHHGFFLGGGFLNFRNASWRFYI